MQVLQNLCSGQKVNGIIACTFSNGSTLLDLGVLQDGLQAGERIKGQRASKNMVAVQTIMLDQNEDEVDTLKFFKGHHWVTAKS